MRELDLDRLSEDGRFLIVRDAASGDQFHLRADHRLISLIGASSQRPATSGQLEIKMESTLSPRDIQTRIRRGETAESVAESAGVPVENIAGFAGPVLAEREYMADQARKSAVRRQHVSGAAVPLGELVSDHIARAGGFPDDALWDAWRREDGRWTVQIIPGAEDSQRATFIFDAKGRYVLPADEFAHSLIGDVALTESSDMAIADAVRAEPVDDKVVVESVAADDTPLEELVDDESSAPISSLTAAREKRAMEQLATEIEAEAVEAAAATQPEAEADDFEDAIEHDVAVPDTAMPRKKRHDRRSVPSWDEIMFGGDKDH